VVEGTFVNPNGPFLRGIARFGFSFTSTLGAYNFRMTSWVCALLAIGTVLAGFDSGPTEALASEQTLLQRFLAKVEGPPVEYRALRHLEASNLHFHQSATMDVWTEYDNKNGFRYQVASESGSSYIRKKVFLAALDGEQKMWMNREPQRASFSHENYTFQDGAMAADGLASLLVAPRRKDVLLVEGSLFVLPNEGDLVRIEGRLSKNPSLWTRRVDVIRRYARLAGVRVPISFESVANVLIAGRSTFKMTYDYEIINGHRMKPQTAP